jgi:hypothetical protein
VPTGRTLFEASSGAASDTLEVAVDLEGPEVIVTSPPAQSVLGGGSVTFSGTVTDRYDFDQPPGPSLPVMTEVIWNVWDQAIGMVIQTGRVPLVDGRFTVPDLSLPAGEYLLEAGAMDAAGNVAFGGVTVTSDPDAPALALVSPLDGEAVLAADVAVDLNFAAPTTIVAVNGAPDGRSFPAGFAGGALTLSLAFGPNVFTLDVEAGGSAFQFSFTLFRVDELGQVRIESPSDGKLLNTPTVTVRGTVPRGTPLVEVNGTPAVIAADGVSFEAMGVPLREGANPIRAVAYPLGREALVTVTGDFTPPRFLAFVPEDGTATTAPEVALAGFLSEGGSLELQGLGGEVTGSAIFAGTFGSGPFATARYRFDLGPLALDPGPNALLLRATDGAGNVAEETFTLTRSEGALLFAAPTAPVPALRADVTLEVLEPVTLLAWYAEGRRVPAVEGGSLTQGFVPVPSIPLLPGTNAMRVVYQRAGGVPEVLTFEVESSATEVAVVEGVVTDTATGLPVAGALVQITVNGVTLAVVTDAEGRYQVEVEPGPFVVAAVGEGYAAGGASGAGTGGATTVADVGLAPTGLPGIQNQVAILVPPDGTVTDFEQLTVVGTVLNPGSVVTVNGIAAEVVGSRFTARHVPLAMGANTLHVTAAALGSPAATHAVGVERAAEPVLSVKLFSPPEGARIPGSGLVVRGFASAKGASAVIGDRMVPVFEGVFEALDVPVSPQQAQLVATARSPEGAALDASLNIRVERAAPAIHLEADPVSGEAPLSVTLEATLGSAFAVSRIDFDLDGDGDLDVVGQQSGEAQVSFAVPRPRSPRVFVSTPEGVELTAVAQVGVFLAPQTLRTLAVGNPVDLAEGVDGSVFVLDGAAGSIRRFAADGTLLQTIGTAGAGADQLSNPQGLAVASDGTVYVADTGNHRVQVYGSGGGWQRSIGSEGAGLGRLRAPRAVALDEDGFLVVADSGNARLQRIRLDGGGAESVPLSGATGLSAISGAGVVAASPVAGTLMSWLGGRLQDLPALGTLPAAGRLVAPTDVAEGADGVVVGDASRAGVVLLDSGLRFRRAIDGLGTIRAVLPSRRRELESIFVADGARVTEIGFPTESPLPTVEALRERLAAGDISGALAHIVPSQRARYARIYDLIASELATEAAAMADAFVLRLRDEEAVVILRRTEVFRGQTVVNGYPVHLIRSGAGEWQVLDY